jgi:thiamine biosynthesis lipoprotein
MVKGASVTKRLLSVVALVCALAGALAAVAGCEAEPSPYTAGREILGTAVTVSAWGSDEAALKPGVDAAFAEMTKVEADLDPYDATSTVAAFNATPYEWHALPLAATEILDRIARLDVGSQFSPTLFGVTNLYDFGGKGSVPETWALNVQVGAAAAFERQGTRARFDRSRVLPFEMTALPEGFGPHPGLDFGGAAKGLALDRAMARLHQVPGIAGAMISAGSSTQVWGAKTDGEPWRVGIEDPRETGTVLAVIGTGSAPEPVNISTSGDYQLFFERSGVRYHHILDPKTGAPARGLRSLTVYGAMSGLDADILSTALFVMGPSAAKEWAERNKVGLYAVDDRGRVVAVSAPKGAGVTFERTGTPRP